MDTDITRKRPGMIGSVPAFDFVAVAKAMLTPIQKVYAGYLAMRVKKLLLANPDTNEVITGISDCETVGDCKYRITATDFNGTKYRITIEVAP